MVVLSDVVERLSCPHYRDVYADLFDWLANRYGYMMMCCSFGEVT